VSLIFLKWSMSKHQHRERVAVAARARLLLARQVHERAAVEQARSSESVIDWTRQPALVLRQLVEAQRGAEDDDDREGPFVRPSMMSAGGSRRSPLW